MHLIKKWGYLPAAIGIVVLAFTLISLFDILIAVFYSRFYSTAAFIVIFGVGGIFAGIYCYSISVSLAPVKNEFTRWSVIILIIITGLAFFFPLASLEGGEYEAAFRSFGVTVALSTLLFTKGKVEL